MTEINKIEKSLLKTRKSLRDICLELGLDMPDIEDLCIEQCAHCSVWHYQFKLREDLDGNTICKYCEDLVGR